MASTLLALDFFSARPAWPTAAWLGAACGLAGSGKYLGLLLLLVALPWVIRHSARKTLLPAFAGGFLASFLFFNFQFLLHLDKLWEAFHYEFKAAQIGGAKGLTRDIPHGKYVGVFQDNVGWPVWIGLAGYLGGWFWRRQTRRGNDLICLVVPIAYAVLLSFSPKTANRYFLAVSPLLLFCGSVGLVWLADGLSEWKRLARWPSWPRLSPLLLLPALALVALVIQARLTLPYSWTFKGDSRMELAMWIAANLPEGSQLVSETRVGLLEATTWKHARPRPDLRIQQSVFAPDLGTYEDLQKGGVRYVAVIKTGFGGYLSKGRKPSPNQERLHLARSTFYQTLFDQSKLLKKCGGKGVGHLNPEVRIYEVPAP
jgi:hypothetical protein